LVRSFSRCFCFCVLMLAHLCQSETLPPLALDLMRRSPLASSLSLFPPFFSIFLPFFVSLISRVHCLSSCWFDVQERVLCHVEGFPPVSELSRLQTFPLTGGFSSFSLTRCPSGLLWSCLTSRVLAGFQKRSDLFPFPVLYHRPYFFL